MNEWIDVNSLLPQDENQVIVTDGVNVTCASYLQWTNSTGWNVGSNFNPITFWMNLPIPPILRKEIP